MSRFATRSEALEPRSSGWKALALLPLLCACGEGLSSFDVDDPRGEEGVPGDEELGVDVGLLSPGPVAAYACDEASGTTLRDFSGNGNVGTLKNGATFGGPAANSVLVFDGSNDFVHVASSASLNLGGNKISLSAWVNFVDSGADQIFLAKPASSSTHVRPYFAYSLHGVRVGPTALRPRLWLTLGGTGRVVASSRIISPGWHFIAGTYDGAAMKIYVDGTLTGSLAASGNLSTWQTPLRLGTNGGFTESFKGKMDNVRVYARALTQTEVRADMGRPVGGAGASHDGGTAADAGTPPDAGSRVDGGVQSTGSAKVIFQHDFNNGWNGAKWTVVNNGNAADVTIAADPAGTGRKVARLLLDYARSEVEYRTQIQPIGWGGPCRSGRFCHGLEYWIGFSYYFPVRSGGWENTYLGFNVYDFHHRSWNREQECPNGVYGITPFNFFWESSDEVSAMIQGDNDPCAAAPRDRQILFGAYQGVTPRFARGVWVDIVHRIVLQHNPAARPAPIHEMWVDLKDGRGYRVLYRDSGINTYIDPDGGLYPKFGPYVWYWNDKHGGRYVNAPDNFEPKFRVLYMRGLKIAQGTNGFPVVDPQRWPQ